MQVTGAEAVAAALRELDPERAALARVHIGNFTRRHAAPQRAGSEVLVASRAASAVDLFVGAAGGTLEGRNRGRAADHGPSLHVAQQPMAPRSAFNSQAMSVQIGHAHSKVFLGSMHGQIHPISSLIVRPIPTSHLNDKFRAKKEAVLSEGEPKVKGGGGRGAKENK